MKTVSVILFGALFSDAERRWNQLLKEVLERESGGKLCVTLPQDQAKEFIAGGQVDFEGIFQKDLQNCVTHDLAVAVLDGPDADSGTCIEIGYRHGRLPNAITIGVRTDFRGSEDGGLNAMLRLCTEVVYVTWPDTAIEEIARNIIQAASKHFKELVIV